MNFDTQMKTWTLMCAIKKFNCIYFTYLQNFSTEYVNCKLNLKYSSGKLYVDVKVDICMFLFYIFIGFYYEYLNWIWRTLVEMVSDTFVIHIIINSEINLSSFRLSYHTCSCITGWGFIKEKSFRFILINCLAQIVPFFLLWQFWCWD